jgi:hypothetical protein
MRPDRRHLAFEFKTTWERVCALYGKRVYGDFRIRSARLRYASAVAADCFVPLEHGMIPRNYSITFTSKEEAQKQGYTVATDIYPWTAYKGPRFAPTEVQRCLTQHESQMLQTLKECRTALIAAMFQLHEHEMSVPSSASAAVHRVNDIQRQYIRKGLTPT